MNRPDAPDRPAWLARLHAAMAPWAGRGSWSRSRAAATASGCSGGWSRSARVVLRLSVACFDHGTRAGASARTPPSWRSWRRALDLPCDLGHWPSPRAGHFEADARRARYAWLLDVAPQRGATVGRRRPHERRSGRDDPAPGRPRDRPARAGGDGAPPTARPRRDAGPAAPGGDARSRFALTSSPRSRLARRRQQPRPVPDPRPDSPRPAPRAGRRLQPGRGRRPDPPRPPGRGGVPAGGSPGAPAARARDRRPGRDADHPRPRRAPARCAPTAGSP